MRITRRTRPCRFGCHVTFRTRKWNRFPSFRSSMTGCPVWSDHRTISIGDVGSSVTRWTTAPTSIREQLVQLREDRRTLDADLEHLVIGERGEASNPQGRNLFREEQTRVRGRPQTPTFFLEIRRLQASKPSAFVGGFGQRPRLREDVGVDLPKDPADGRADRTEILPALQEPDGGASGVRDSERFGCDLHDRPRECREDAGNPDDKVPGHEGASPDESLRVVEEVVRELTVFDFHEEGSSTRRTSARRSSASASDRTLSSGASKSVAAPRGDTVAPFTLTGPPLRTYR